jgi:hypothetical protein
MKATLYHGFRFPNAIIQHGIVKLAALQRLKLVAGSNYAASSAASRHAAKASARN